MRKIYMTFAAALFAVAAFAQPLARNHQANGQITSPLRYQAQSVPQSWQKTDFLLPNFGKARPMLAPNLQVTDDMQMIVDQPEGTLYHNYYGVNSGFEVFFGTVISTTVDGVAQDFVIADDGTMYIKNIMATLGPNVWVKGQKTGDDVYTFTFPQKYYKQPVYDENNEATSEFEDFYLFRMKINDAGNSFIPDTESQDIRFAFRNDSLIRLDDNSDGVVLALATADGEWVGFADFASEWHKEKAPIEAPSASATVSDYMITYGNEENDRDAALVKVALEGDGFYISNLSGSNPDAWAKGKVDGDKVVFDGMKYLGVDPVLGYHTYFAPSGKQKVTWEDYDYTFDSLYFEKELVFAYDRTANTLKSETNFLVNAGKNVVYKVNEYEKPMLTPWKEEAGTPKDPSVFEFMPYESEYGYGCMQIHVNKESTDGKLLNPNKLFYNIYFDDALFTFYPDEYAALVDEITDVPIDFTDNNDIVKKGTNRKIYYFLQGMTTVGVQEIYKDGDTTYKSNLVSYKVDERGNLTGISRDITTGSEEVKSVSYTDLAGRRISKPAHGIFLKTVKYADGSQKTVKYVR